jgi:S1-C subfamily serine protease
VIVRNVRQRWFAYLAILALAACLSTATASEVDVAGVFKKVRGSVVVIQTVEKKLVTQGGVRRKVSAPGLGSGVLVRVKDPKKDVEVVRVVTAAHVVQAADRLVVVYPGGKRSPARVLSSHTAADLALLEVDVIPPGTPTVRLGDSDALEVGERVFVVGAPYGLSHSLSVGYVSAKRASPKMVGGLSRLELIQTDAAINTGNSGGPMFNMRGEIVGIVSHILSRSGGFEGMGFAVSSNVARRILLEAPQIWSGINGIVVSGELAAALNVPQKMGLLVQQVAVGSPAHRWGIREGTIPAVIGGKEMLLGGDIALSAQGIEFTMEGDAMARIRKALAAVKPGEKAVVTVLRAGKKVRLESVREED